MKRYLTIMAIVGIAHFLIVNPVYFLSSKPVFINLYLGVFDSSESIGSLFLLFMLPVTWCLRTFGLESDASIPWLSIALASSSLYSLVAAGVVAAYRLSHNEHSYN